jgi:hypothetical protein
MTLKERSAPAGLLRYVKPVETDNLIAMDILASPTSLNFLVVPQLKFFSDYFCLLKKSWFRKFGNQIRYHKRREVEACCLGQSVSSGTCW